MDEHAMAAWCQQFPHDVLEERAFFVQRREGRSAYHEDGHMRKKVVLFHIKLNEASTWDPDDERWADAFITMEESNTSTSEEDDEE
ncbi:t-complex protein 1 subunit eta [Hordeum vulgare]|nr:t-complex protein 1 subunit eta [Hordeum vulgare]